MQENRFFKWVWRLNSLFILLLVVFLAIFSLSEIFSKIIGRKGEEEIIINVADDPKGKEKWVLGHSTHIKGSDFIILPLVSENKEVETSSSRMILSESYASSPRDPAKNILFMNTSENESFWLFDDNDRLILNTQQFPYSNQSNSESNKTMIIFYEVIRKDSNGDGTLNYDDKSSLASTNPDGSAYQIIIDKFDRIITKSLAGSDKILIVYQNDGIGYSMQFQLFPFKPLSLKELPKVTE